MSVNSKIPITGGADLFPGKNTGAGKKGSGKGRKAPDVVAPANGHVLQVRTEYLSTVQP